MGFFLLVGFAFGFFTVCRVSIEKAKLLDVNSINTSTGGLYYAMFKAIGMTSLFLHTFQDAISFLM